MKRATRLLLAAALVHPALAWPHAATTNTVLFDREIVRILEAHCVMCHAEGGPAFALETYEQTWLARNEIHDAVIAGHMPPWSAVPGYGEFRNTNRLTLREQRFVVSWVEGLGPRNDGLVFMNVLSPGEPRAEVRAEPAFERWQLGDPDRVVAIDAERSPAGASHGALERYRVIVDPELGDAIAIHALEYRPEDRSGLHAAVFRLASSGQWLATWTPWHSVREWHDGIAVEVPAGERLVIDFYGAEGAAWPGGSLGLHRASGTGRRAGELVLEPIVDQPSVSTDAETTIRLRDERVLDAPLELLSIWPELPADTQTLEITARHRDGRVEVLMLAIDMVAEWPTPYVLEAPVRLPRGTRLTATAYVGSDMRPGANRDQRVTVTFGTAPPSTRR